MLFEKSLKILRQLALPVLATAGVLSLGSALGQTFTWLDVNGLWSDLSKWVGGQKPSGADATDQLVFGSGSGYTSTNDIATPAPLVVNQLTFSGATSAFNTITGNAIKLAGTSPQISQNSAAEFVVRTPIQLGAPTTIGGTGSGALTISGLISGKFGLTKNGAGTVRFSATAAGVPSESTFFGGLTISGGTVAFANAGTAANAVDSSATALRSNRVTIAAGATLSSNAELRLGELSGAGTLQGQDLTTGNGQDIILSTLGDATFTGSIINTRVGAGTVEGQFIVRGVGKQTLQTAAGALSVNNDFVVGRGATLVFAGSTSVVGTADKGKVVVNGGTFVLDNSATNNNNRLRDFGPSFTIDTGLETIGGGTFSLLGNASGTAETIGRLQLGSSNITNGARAGALTINVTAPGAGAVSLTMQSYSRDSVSTPRTTVDFTANGGTGTLGAIPKIFIGGTVNLTAGGLISSSNVVTTQAGWATVNGSGFATYNATNGVVAVATTNVSGTLASNATQNARLIGSGTINSASDFLLSSLKIDPGVGQSLSITGTGSLNTNAILLAGNNDFSIINAGGTGGMSGPGGSRYFHVQKPDVTLTVGVSLAKLDTSATPAQDSVTKAGLGTLALTSTDNVTLNKTLTINAGTVRATPGSTLPSGKIELRGGVLELTGASGFTYNALVGSAAGYVDWSDPTNSNDRGSGGFSAFGVPVIVSLSTAAAGVNLSWEQSGFVNSGHALVFGSTRSDARLTFSSNLSLTQPPTVLTGASNDVNYNLREVRVIDGTTSTADFTRVSGVVSGSVRNDLLKTGSGTLELTNTNTFSGATIVHAGTLQVSGSIAASFVTRVRNLATLAGRGTVGNLEVETGGILAPGDIAGPAEFAATRTGTLTVGDTAFGGAASKLKLEIGGLGAGSHDRLSVNGAISLNGATLDGTLLNGFTPVIGDLFFIVLNDGADAVSGTFAQGGRIAFGGRTFDIGYTGNFVADGSGSNAFTGGNDVVLRVVPEPTSAVLILSGINLLALRRRRRE